MTETLTANERARLNAIVVSVFGNYDVRQKALRIIDALTARAEAADNNAQHCTECVVQAEATADAAESESAALRERCRLLEVNRDSLLERNGRLVDETHRARAESAALRAELQAEKDRRVEHRQMNQSLNEQVHRLSAENERLKAELADTLSGAARRRGYAAETDAQLAAANATLGRVRALLRPVSWEGVPTTITAVSADSLRAALAGQPAAPTRTEAAVPEGEPK